MLGEGKMASVLEVTEYTVLELEGSQRWAGVQARKESHVATFNPIKQCIYPSSYRFLLLKLGKCISND